MTEPGWSPHPQLDSDTVPVGELALSRVLAVNGPTIRGRSWCRGAWASPSSPTSATTPSR